MQLCFTFCLVIVVGNPTTGDRGVFCVGSLSSNLLAVDGNDKIIDE